MIFTKCINFLAAAVLCAAEVKEVIDGNIFVHWGPKMETTVVDYELPTYKFALDLLEKRQAQCGDYCDYENKKSATLATSNCDELDKLKKKLSHLKKKLGADRIEKILQPDIQEADNFWHKIINQSTKGNWIAVDAHGVAFLPNLTASTFAAWTQSPLADEANNDANAEHYFKRTVQLDDGSLAAEILEGWGGITTLFNIPSYGSPAALGYDFLRPNDLYPIQAAGKKVLSDGTDEIMGILHISIRDVSGKQWDIGGNGVEVFSTIWYGDASTDEFLEDERQHMVIEIVRLTQAAQRDIEAGRFPIAE